MDHLTLLAKNAGINSQISHRFMAIHMPLTSCLTEAAASISTLKMEVTRSADGPVQIMVRSSNIPIDPSLRMTLLGGRISQHMADPMNCRNIASGQQTTRFPTRRTSAYHDDDKCEVDTRAQGSDGTVSHRQGKSNNGANQSSGLELSKKNRDELQDTRQYCDIHALTMIQKRENARPLSFSIGRDIMRAP